MPQPNQRGGFTFPQPGARASGPIQQWGQNPPGGFGGIFGGGFGGGMSGTGRAGALRLFTPPLSKEVSWLLPFGLFGAVLLAFRARPRWPLARKHQALVLWGGWLLTCMVFFSVAGFFHEYYMSMLAPQIAALVGIGTAELWCVRGRHPWIAATLLLIAAGVTLELQGATARAFTASAWWLPLAVALLAIGAVLLAGSAIRRMPRAATAGFSCVVAALLVTPGIWSGLTALNPTANQSLPSAYAGRPSGPEHGGGLQVNQALLGYLESHTQGAKYLVAVPSSMQGADYVLATGRPVLYLGGFMGQDEVVTGDDLTRMVAAGELRYIYWNSSTRFGGRGGNSDISAWVEAHCVPVQGFDTETRNSGSPDGTAGGATGGAFFGGPGGMQVTLYECVPNASP